MRFITDVFLIVAAITAFEIVTHWGQKADATTVVVFALSLVIGCMSRAREGR